MGYFISDAMPFFDREWNSRSLISLFSVDVSTSITLVKQPFQFFLQFPLLLPFLSFTNYFSSPPFLIFTNSTNVPTYSPKEAILSVYPFFNFSYFPTLSRSTFSNSRSWNGFSSILVITLESFFTDSWNSRMDSESFDNFLNSILLLLGSTHFVVTS